MAQNKIAVVIENGRVVDTVQPRDTEVFVFDKDTQDAETEMEMQVFNEEKLESEDVNRIINVLEKKANT